MFKNFLLVTYRNLHRQKTYVIINVLGLGLALALCIVAYHNHRFATDFDRNHENLEKIYKINVTKSVNDEEVAYAITPMSLANAMKEDGLSFDKISRYADSYDAVKYKDNIFNVSIGYGDDDYFDMFTFPLVNGGKADLSDPSTIYFTVATAEKFFGDEDPVGEILTVTNFEGKNYEFTVGGVLEDIPLNTCMQFGAIVNFENFNHIASIEDPNDWTRFIAATFITINDNNRADQVEARLAKYLPIQNASRQDWKASSFYLEPMTETGFNGRSIMTYWLWEAMHPAAIMAPSVMALMILLIACFNFTNTSIAFSNRRLKEIGVRKVLGGRRIHLILQFMGENMLLCFLALLVGLILANYLVPAYSAMWEYLELTINFREDYPFYLFLVALLLFTGLLAGMYPALYISGFQPIKILSKSLKVKSTGMFSKFLLTAQFSISILALISGVVFTQNAKFQKQMDLGYEKENIITVRANNHSQYQVFRNAIEGHSKIKSVAGSEQHVGWGYYSRTVRNEENTEVDVMTLNVGPNYFKTMNMNLVEGREFDANRIETDSRESVVINQLLAEQMYWENPIGQKLIISDTLQFNVIGVLRNFYLDDFYGPIEPSMFRLNGEENNYLLLAQVAPQDMAEVNKYFEATWKQLHPYTPYNSFFQYDLLEDASTVNTNIVYIFMFLSVLAVIMSAIGLFTLVSMQIMSRTKEMGIRKVLGASIAHLMGLINRQFFIILGIASLVGIVGGYYMTELLLDSIYEVYFRMNLISFIIPVLIVLIVAGLIIGGKVFKASMRNPVDSLRYE